MRLVQENNKGVELRKGVGAPMTKSEKGRIEG
jgi:hypothetical protein